MLTNAREGWQTRLELANGLIRDLGDRGRQFFHRGDVYAAFEVHDGELRWRDDYTRKLVRPSDGGPRAADNRARFSHGGSLWALVTSLADYVTSGDPTLYGGLFGRHLGYPQEDMLALVLRAREIGFYHRPEEIDARHAILRKDDPQRPAGSSFRIGGHPREIVVLMDWDGEDGSPCRAALAECGSDRAAALALVGIYEATQEAAAPAMTPAF